MNWNNEPWRKLYTRLTGEWSQLSVMARGVSCELLKYAKDDGSVCRTKGKDPALSVALILSPQPHELETVQDGVQELLDDGFLTVTEDVICIRNFEEAQERRSPAAVRQKRHRERNEKRDTKRESNKNDNKRTTAACDTSVTDERDSRNALSQGDETRRDETNTDSPSGKTGVSTQVMEQANLALVHTEPEPKAPPKRKPDKPSSETYELVAAYEDLWVRHRRPEDGKPLPRDGAVFAQAKKLVEEHTLPVAMKYVVMFFADTDAFVANRGYMFADIRSRVARYKSGVPPPTPGGRKSLPASTSTTDATRALRKF